MRIASLLASGTEIVHLLGLSDRLVAISHECDFPPEITRLPRITRALIDAEASSLSIDDQVRKRAQAGLPLYAVDESLLADLRPDLILTQDHCEICAVSDRDVAACVARHPGLAEMGVVSLHPTSLESVFSDVLRVAEAAGVVETGRQSVAGLRTRIDRVRALTEGLREADRPRTLCIEWIAPLMVAANWMPDLVALAGGRCDLTRSGDRSGVTPWPAVAAFAPELIIAMPCGLDLARTVKEACVLRDLPGWGELEAVRRGRVYAVDGNAYFNRSGPRLVDSLEILAHLAHPERVSPPQHVGSDAWARLA